MVDKNIEEIRVNLKKRLKKNIKVCLEELAIYQQNQQWRYLWPHIHTFNQKYLVYQHARQTRYWSYRQKRIRHEMLSQDLSFFIANLVVFEYSKTDGTSISLIIVNGDHNIVAQDLEKSKINILK